MDERTTNSLLKLFDRHRIIFWYDDKKELRSEYEELSLSGIEKLEIDNNEFMLKHRVLREQRDQKFLIYHKGPKPANRNNWLLDVLLSHAEFRVDQAAIILAELDLDLSFIDAVRQYAFFFNAKKRTEDLKALLEKHETQQSFRMKMLAACSGAESPQLDHVLLQLISEASENRDEKFRSIENCSLGEFLWKQVETVYGYASHNPSIADFVHELFKGCFSMDLGQKTSLKSEAKVFMKQWKDYRLYEDSYIHYAGVCEHALDIQEKVSSLDFRKLMGMDYFEYLDKFIIQNMIVEVTARTSSNDSVFQWVNARRNSVWHETYQHYYGAISYASWFFKLIEEVNLTMESLAEGFKQYVSSWYQVDQVYRKYLYHCRKVTNPGLLDALGTAIENRYTDQFLLTVNNRWQNLVDTSPQWRVDGSTSQRYFYQHYIKPYVEKDRKICVVISDAMRYEVGEELASAINGQNKYVAEIEPMLSSLPSYTQLGMASLLPNTELVIKDDGTVLVDGKPSQGSANRETILKGATNGKALVIDASAVLSMKTDELRTLVRDNLVIYVYHDIIDSTGGKRDSEERVSVAAEEAIEELTKLVIRLSSGNASNIIVTSDHGFLYQDRALDESDFASDKTEGDGILLQNRRFVLGRKLKENPSLRSFTSKELGLGGDLEIQIAKSINRLRKQGTGSRFVHGGATLQEVVVPVLKISKQRQSDIAQVDVETPMTSNRITSWQLGVTFYQKQPVTEKMQKRIIRAGIYTAEGELISDSRELIFDSKYEDNRKRESIERFMISHKASSMKKQDVYLRLEEPIEGTNQWKKYRDILYVMQLQITPDF